MAIFYTNSASFNSLQVTGSANITSTSGIALQLKSSGSTIFSISGSSGEIFNISDTTSTNLFSVGNGSTTVFSIDNTNATRISGSLLVTGSVVVTGSVKVLNGITGSVFGTSSWAVSASYAPSSNAFPYNGNAQITGSLSVTGGITGSLFGNASTATSATSATSATTASLVNGNVNVTTATIGNTTYASTTTNAAAGTTVIYSVPVTSYSSIFVDYVIKEGATNSRAGTIQTVWLGSDINYTESTTMDIGNTDDFVWEVTNDGTDIFFNALVVASSWIIKFNARQM
jgi:hypothetical protein